MYNLPQPPYLLIAVGLLMSLSSGVVFARLIKKLVQDWSENPATCNIVTMRGLTLQIPYLGIASGALIFLSSSLQLFGFTNLVAYSICLPLTIGTGLVVWIQLTKILDKMEQGINDKN
ncbi:MAG: hypothetical protein O4861_21260 [Trichodesmium sp. St16_bin4-tuft]|uniref:Uncharacterized protein n=1 Tax=Trichodesmium erythraeum (strain IMS101) TaxID=203124 RepID=Q111V5_TRIEI|nr:hypothetical protein [Trichodesmium erythraeum GBRTRLIN201]MCH2049662.1 hypothetical protein [Trichodesmium sp. ALOHA_ZT_67]MDE5072921.1 hypothetical protein [Trichodesmium sp. St5_bin8]MDE5078434.1 hypothetical protein [Trichodesmium sp. St2_bin6]MDE5096703.1 hypothetical protein [Trichodesmium sp. St11_bin5]MDE5100720.1 hypothetical protein [Trichodesmium sp. St16_bin4-tuft]MDE5104269.1 hypothetical protein [Trichodesmium sp. St19_bin2]MDT9340335.1 hypothetical protein [Trichodesmium er